MRVFTVFDGVSVSLCVGAGQGRGGGGGLGEEAKFPKLASHRRKDSRLIIPRTPIPTA